MYDTFGKMLLLSRILLQVELCLYNLNVQQHTFIFKFWFRIRLFPANVFKLNSKSWVKCLEVILLLCFHIKNSIENSIETLATAHFPAFKQQTILMRSLHNQNIYIYRFFKGVLGTRFGSLELKIGSLESEKIIIGSLESEKIGSRESEKSGP